MGYFASIVDEEAEARRVLDAIELPADVLGYGIRLGEDGTDPALWITFQTTIANDMPHDELRLAAGRMNQLAAATREALLDANPRRYPYFTFAAGR